MSKLTPIPDGFQTTGPLGSTLTYDAKSGQFTGGGIGGANTASPSTISGVNEGKSGSITDAVAAIPKAILSGAGSIVKVALGDIGPRRLDPHRRHVRAPVGHGERRSAAG